MTRASLHARSEDVPAAVVDDAACEAFVEFLHREHHHDFRGYARSSLVRRLALACRRFGCASIAELEHALRARPVRIAELLGCLTVQVSDAFRDPEYFLAVRQHVVPFLRSEPAPRLWVAGCSSGEEVLSLAIVLREEGLLERTRIYATDIDPSALDEAAAGVYDTSRVAGFAERHRAAGGRSSMSEHCTADYGRVLFDRELRDRVVFAEHSLATDSVFAEVQFVSCRNVLIYFDKALQERAVSLFREALAGGGFLGVGARESLRGCEAARGLREIPGSGRLYRRQDAP